ncbi:MAG: glycosyltransferase family 9 protein [Desulfobacterales bacterium]|nr:glycosyltransferase family 9 protein [Desulfobacterales bacterium]
MKKILIIKMTAIGDVFMALAHIEAIVSHHVDDEIWLLTDPMVEKIFRYHPRVKVALLRKGTPGRESSLARVFWVRSQRFDVIYDLQGNRTSRRLARFSSAPVRVGTQPRAVYNRHPENFYARGTQQNVFDRLDETLAAGGLPPAQPRIQIHAPPADIYGMDQWKKKYDLWNGLYVLLHAGSSRDWFIKRWPAAHFLALARMIEKQGIRCVWIGGRDDRAVNEQLSGHVGMDTTNQLNMLQLYLLGKGAGFAVANDSAPMHIMAASGIPVYGLFGPTSWIRSHAVGQKERVFYMDMPCSPCFKKKCRAAKKHACLDEIGPEAVFRKIMAGVSQVNKTPDYGLQLPVDG